MQDLSLYQNLQAVGGSPYQVYQKLQAVVGLLVVVGLCHCQMVKVGATLLCQVVSPETLLYQICQNLEDVVVIVVAEIPVGQLVAVILDVDMPVQLWTVLYRHVPVRHPYLGMVQK